MSVLPQAPPTGADHHDTSGGAMAPAAGTAMPAHVDPNQYDPTAPPHAPTAMTPAVAQTAVPPTPHAPAYTPPATYTPPAMVPGAPHHMTPMGAVGAPPAVHVGPPGTTPLSHRGREKLHWPHEVWQRLDRVVAEECHRTKVGRRFLHVHRVPEQTTSVPAEIVLPPSPVGGAALVPGGVLAAVAGAPAPPPILRWNPPQAPPVTVNTFAVDEGQEIRILEIWAEFSLTPQQVEHEANQPHSAHDAHAHHDPHAHHDGHAHHDHHGRAHGGHTAAELARRTAQVLSEAEDMLIFNGLGAFSTPAFSSYIRYRPGALPIDWGMLDVIPPGVPMPPLGPLPQQQVFQVQLFVDPAGNAQSNVYANQTFKSVTAGYAQLIANAQPGPFALVLHNIPYADSFAPLAETLIMPADRIAPLMTAGFYDSGTIDAPGYQAMSEGLIAAGGDTTAAGGQTRAANAAANYLVNYTQDLGAIAATAANAAFLASGVAIPGKYNPTAAQVTLGQNAAFNAATAANAAAPAGSQPFPNLPGNANGINVTKALPSFYGSLVSLGGQTVDLVVGIEPIVAYMQQDVDGSHRFRVLERIALRPKDLGAFIRLEFV